MGSGRSEEVRAVARPEQVKGSLLERRVRSVHLSGVHCFAICDDFEVFGWGSNSEGQLGMNDRGEYGYPEIVSCLSSKRIVDISCSPYHTLCVSELGVAYSMGFNRFGQLGHGDTDGYPLARPIAFLRSHKVKQVSAGFEHSLFLVDQLRFPTHSTSKE
jgi:alpha-tubulin suppressor-like RCC1 family protein